MVERVSDPERPVGSVAGAVGTVELVGSDTFLARCSMEQMEGFGAGLVNAEGVIVVVANDEIAFGVEGEVFGAIEPCFQCRSVVTR